MSARLTGSGLVVGIALMALSFGACNPLPATADGNGSLLVITQVPPRDGASAIPDRLRPDARYPSGSRIVLVDATGPNKRPVLLSGDLETAGAPRLSPDATSLLFAGKEARDSTWGIYEVGLARPRPRLVVRIDRDCIDPAHLPDGRLVMTCRDEDSEGWSLHVASRAGSGVQRITFGPGSAFDPVPLPDGRILFPMWQGDGPGRPAGGATALFTVNPDGTLLEPFSGSHDAPEIKVRPRPSADAGIVFVAADRAGGVSRIERVDMSRPQASRRPLRMAPPFDGKGDASGALLPVAAEPLPEGRLLLAARVEGKETTGVFRTSGEGRPVEPVFDAPDWDEVEAVPVLAGATPRGRPSTVNPELSRGTLVCYDAQRSDGRVGPSPAAPRAATVSFHLLDGRGSRTDRELGRVPVEADGSFHVEVPADVPLRVVSRDDGGRVISASGWFWVRPGEVRACFGCHESRESAPVNRVVAALAGEPHRLEPSQEEPAR